MKSFKYKLIIAILTFALGFITFFIWSSFKTLPDAIQTELISSPRSNELTLRISAQKTDVKVGEEISLKAFIRNNGNEKVTLVSPGDGSNEALRTPITQWSVIKNNSRTQHHFEPILGEVIPYCIYMNPLKSDEVFSLAFGESKELNNFIFLPPFSEPGVYRVALLYANRPDLQWRNESSLHHDSHAFLLVKNSTETTITSNEIIFMVHK